MQFTEVITTLITLETFSSIWYWMAVAVSWAAASHWLIGVPFDVLFQARKSTSPHIDTLETFVEINVRRINYLNELAGSVAVGLATFVLVSLALLGFGYGNELAQGVFILGAPLTLVGLINARLAKQLARTPLSGAALVRKMFAVRFWTQFIAMISIFLTSVYGMYFIMTTQVIFFGWLTP